MGYPDYKGDLLAAQLDVDGMLDRYFHCGQSVAFYGAAPEVEPTFKNYISRALYDSLGVRLHPLELVICGSAHLGFSPVPDKLGKPFDASKSDIDVAIVSAELFDRWWFELQSCDLVPGTRSRVAEDLFWGFINPASVATTSEIGRRWWNTLGSIRTDRANGVRGRLYRSYWFMQNYHRRAIVDGRNKLLNVRV